MRLAGQLHPAADPQLDADPLAVAEQLALRILDGGSWSRFIDQYLEALPQLPVLTLAALATELFARYANDEARVVRALAHESGRQPEYRRTPRQLLADMHAAGFRAPPTPAMRRAEEAYLATLADDLDAPTAAPGSMLLN